MSPSHPDGVGPRSRAYNECTAQLFPGGVSSPVRAFKAVGGQPPVIRKARGAVGRFIDFLQRYHDSAVTESCNYAAMTEQLIDELDYLRDWNRRETEFV